MNERRFKHWGWGYQDQQPTEQAMRQTAELAAEHLGLALSEIEAPVALERLQLREPRVRPPAELAEICASDDHARASHALGKSYVDVVEGFRGRFEHPPDFVARPREESDVERLLEWCAGEGVAAIPFGGGTSVVGGVTPDVPSTFNGAVTIDLRGLDRVLEVDAVSRAARIQAGAAGPALESQLGEHGLTLRHFPQSFEYSTLGGWIATRAAGHFATGRTHIEDYVESARAITPAGVWQSRRLPGSGAGPSPDRMLAGSEGALGRDHRGLGARAAAPVAQALGRRALPDLRRRRRVRARALAVRSRTGQLPPDRRARGGDDDGRRRQPRAARARLRVDRPPGRRGARAGAGDLRRARRRRARGAQRGRRERRRRS